MKLSYKNHSPYLNIDSIHDNGARLIYPIEIEGRIIQAIRIYDTIGGALVFFKSDNQELCCTAINISTLRKCKPKLRHSRTYLSAADTLSYFL